MFASDFHLRDCTSDKYIADIAHMLASQGADILLLGGDYGESADASLRLFRTIDRNRFPLGIYGVAGNNDTEVFSDAAELRALFPGRLLVNETSSIPLGRSSLIIGGHADLKYGSMPRKSIFPGTSNSYSILLSHYPSVIPAYSGPRPQLMLSGHTHGGQINFLGLTAYSVGFEKNTVCAVSGLKTIRGMQLLVSNGIGMSRLPIRFGAAPRVHLIEFV